MGHGLRFPPAPRLPAPSAYALALSLPVVLFAMEALARPWFDPDPWPIPLIAVGAIAWAGGLGPSIIASGLAAGLGFVFLRTSPHAVDAAGAVPSSLVFAAAALLAAFMGAVARASSLERERALEALAESEALAQARAAELGALIEAVPAFVSIARDPRASLVWENPASQEFLGRQVGGRDGSGLRPPPVALMNGRRLSHADSPLVCAAAGETVRDAEVELLFADGTRRRILGNAVPIRTDDGAPRGAVAVFVDVTRQAEALDALRAREEELAAAIRARDAFLSAASHELRTPLTSLSLLIQMLARTVRSSPDPAREVAARLPALERNVTRLTRLVEDLLDVSRLAAGRLSLTLEDLDLAQLVTEVAARFEAEATVDAPAIELEAHGPVRGRWDRLRLEQVANNLLSNALKYGGGRPVRVVVDVRGGAAVLSVTDLGIGIAEQDRIRIFERFERTLEAQNYGGIGIGLWIVREIVEALDGEVTVQSAPGEGSTFTVRLPLEADARDAVGREDEGALRSA